LAKSGVYDLLLAAGLDFGRQNLGVPAVFAGSKAMGGQDEIQRQLPQLLAAFSKAPERVLAQRIIPFADVRDTAGIREQQFRALSPWLVVSAGVLDGINPCAFTVVLFLVSYLSLAKRQKRRILVSGASFTAGVFFCYLLIGIFFFQCSRWLMKNPVFDVIIPGVLALTVFLLAALSLLDAWQSARKGTDKMVLRIPVSLQKRMRSHIRAFANNTSALGAAAFALGVVIASMELACTGQVYLPIVSMIASPEQRSSAMVLLLLYNGAFVLPLVVVFLVAVAGGSSKKLAAFYGHHLPIVKAGMAVLFLVMGVMLVHNLGWI
jgi:cytochrome c biogenesis protein CcdA